ncbi:energy transducer TonB [Rhodanobacter sp. C05]|uniref:energy transducer TonB n=1 Tax=Rhodanobacter sp. C05 TaxID=1945855 RepID=UPI00098718A1|nr:energy transducer TonB [Rhodanobacter sp. C05]
MKILVALLLLALIPLSASAAQCTKAFMRGGEVTKFDPLAHKALDARYRITDVDPGKRPFVSPKPIAGEMPSAPNSSDGQPIHGYVLLAYVVTTSGYAESPTIVEASNARLSTLALAATETWRFQPGKVDGAEVCIVAMQEFEF